MPGTRGCVLTGPFPTPTPREPGPRPSLSVSGTPLLHTPATFLPWWVWPSWHRERECGQEGPRQGQPSPWIAASWPFGLPAHCHVTVTAPALSVGSGSLLPRPLAGTAPHSLASPLVGSGLFLCVSSWCPRHLPEPQVTPPLQPSSCRAPRPFVGTM